MMEKDFELIAEVLRNTRAPMNVIVGMAHKLEATNKNFKTALFIAKCQNPDDFII